MDASWLLFVEQYPQVMAAYPHGIFMQIYKPHWYNQEFNGIHFELALDATCVQNCEFCAYVAIFLQ